MGKCVLKYTLKGNRLLPKAWNGTRYEGGDAIKRFASLPVQKIVLTDSVYRSNEASLPIEVVSLREMLADTIKRLHGGG